MQYPQSIMLKRKFDANIKPPPVDRVKIIIIILFILSPISNVYKDTSSVDL